jgi:hypothetical protein
MVDGYEFEQKKEEEIGEPEHKASGELTQEREAEKKISGWASPTDRKTEPYQTPDTDRPVPRFNSLATPGSIPAAPDTRLCVPTRFYSKTLCQGPSVTYQLPGILQGVSSDLSLMPDQ